MKPLIIEGPISNIGGLFLLEMPTFDEDRNEHYNEMQRADNMGSWVGDKNYEWCCCMRY